MALRSVLGLNGSGKSVYCVSFLWDQNYQDKVVFDKDYKIGISRQEPTLDPEKTVHDRS